LTVEGAGTLAGVASGDYRTTESYTANQRKLFNGRAQLIVRTTKTAGQISVSADAPELKGATISLKSVQKPH